MGSKGAGRPIEDRFWEKVEKGKSGECWNWIGALSKGGYGNLGLGTTGTIYAHRFSYELAVGVIAKGMFVCHSCDNRKCVNPKHLWLGTAADNAADRNGKGRSRGGVPLGEKHHCAKLNGTKVANIKARLANGEKQNGVAALFGVTPQTVFKIKQGKTWKYVS